MDGSIFGACGWIRHKACGALAGAGFVIVSDVGAGGFSELLQTFDDLRMLGGKFVCFGDVIAHVEELEWRGRSFVDEVRTLRFKRQVELPRAAAHGLELIDVVVEEAFFIGG